MSFVATIRPGYFSGFRQQRRFLAAVTGSKIDPDLLAWCRVCANPPPWPQLLLMDAFVKGLKQPVTSASIGAIRTIWSRLGMLIPLFATAASGDLSNACVDLRYPSRPAYAPQGTLYAAMPYAGVTGGGGILNTGLTPGQIPGVTTNDHHLQFYCQSNYQGVTGDLGAHGGAGVEFGAYAKEGGSTFFWSASSVGFKIAATSAVGLHGFSRTDAGEGIAWQDGLSQPWLNPANALPAGVSGQLAIFGSGVVTATRSPNTLAVVTAGASLSAEEAAAFDYAFLVLMSGLGTLQVAMAPQPVVGANAFGMATLPRVLAGGIKRVFAPGNLPSQNNDPKWASGFATDVVGQPSMSNVLTPQTQIERFYQLLWCSRWNGGWAKGPNGYAPVIYNSVGFDCRVEFTTWQRAAIASWVQLAQILGWAPRNEKRDPYGWGYLDYLERAWTLLALETPGQVASPFSGAAYDAALAANPGLAAGTTLVNGSISATGLLTLTGTTRGQLVVGSVLGAADGQLLTTASPKISPTITAANGNGTYQTNVVAAVATGRLYSTCNLDVDTGAVIMTHQRAATQADTVFAFNATYTSNKVARDIVILAASRICDCPFGAGVSWDFEMDDDRPPSGLATLVQVGSAMVAAAGCREADGTPSLAIGFDPLVGAGEHLGLDATNIDAIAQSVFYLSLSNTAAVSLAAGYASETAYLQAQFGPLLSKYPSKVFMQVGVGNLSADTAAQVASRLEMAAEDRAFLLNQGLGGIDIIPAYATLGGGPSRPENLYLDAIYGLAAGYDVANDITPGITDSSTTDSGVIAA